MEKKEIGTIVKLYNLDKLFMIIGYCEKMNLKKIKDFDYFVCEYPIGIVGLKRTMLIKKEEIEKEVYKGYKLNNS